MEPPAGHYFDPSPATPSAAGQVELSLPDLQVLLITDRGVFSPKSIDSGTRYLLGEAAVPTGEERVLVDLGCGYGPIAVTLARRAPWAEVWAVDVNERAVALCARNADALGLANVRAVTPDQVPEGLVIDAIWSNPPIRVGKQALHTVLLAWLARLAPEGRAELVVQRHLGADSLQRWLREQGWPAERLGSRSGYRLLGVDRARPEAAADTPENGPEAGS